MSRPFPRSPWYWVVLGAFLVAFGVFVSDLFLDWAPKWLAVAAAVAPLAVGMWIFRMMWKQSDHPAFHGGEGGTKPPPSINTTDSSATPERDRDT